MHFATCSNPLKKVGRDPIPSPGSRSAARDWFRGQRQKSFQGGVFDAFTVATLFGIWLRHCCIAKEEKETSQEMKTKRLCSADAINQTIGTFAIDP